MQSNGKAARPTILTRRCAWFQSEVTGAAGRPPAAAQTFMPANPPRSANRTGGEKKRMGINHRACTVCPTSIVRPIPTTIPTTHPRNAPAPTQPLWIFGVGEPPEVGR